MHTGSPMHCTAMHIGSPMHCTDMHIGSPMHCTNKHIGSPMGSDLEPQLGNPFQQQQNGRFILEWLKISEISSAGGRMFLRVGMSQRQTLMEELPLAARDEWKVKPSGHEYLDFLKRK
ncbi:hypothetical protein AVEN_118927-1 [Araneus ventricosus]|uniref:Uncharacterized protein n=1 Tax=Araneus ventricosus TaxID=182803 RepID=A0A4Y2BZ41_ARAVE|nr:hypothetical protein AVEN_118927-1 [Araneus ventricosus]